MKKRIARVVEKSGKSHHFCLAIHWVLTKNEVKEEEEGSEIRREEQL